MGVLVLSCIMLPLKFWAEAASTAAYLHNHSSTTAVNGMTPYECWFGQKPNVSNFRVFGCVCFVHTPDNLRKKLDAKSSKAIFVGYPLDTKGCKVYDLALKRFIRSRNVLFHEEKFPDFELDKEQVVFQEIYESGFENIEQPTQTVQREQVVVPENVHPVGAMYEET